MSITRAEQLQRDLTDKYVVVHKGVAELRRFEGLTGTVKTVNMSGRALVMFDGPVDISWYDIDPAYLQVVDQPLPKKSPEHGAKSPAKAAPAKAAGKAAPAPAKGASPLDLIRKQAAGTAAPAAAPAAGKPSPLDLIRKQGAAKPAAAPAAEAVAVQEPPPEPASTETAAPPASAPAKPPSGLSPIELIRQQGAAKR